MEEGDARVGCRGSAPSSCRLLSGLHLVGAVWCKCYQVDAVFNGECYATRLMTCGCVGCVENNNLWRGFASVGDCHGILKPLD